MYFTIYNRSLSAGRGHWEFSALRTSLAALLFFWTATSFWMISAFSFARAGRSFPPAYGFPFDHVESHGQ